MYPRVTGGRRSWPFSAVMELPKMMRRRLPLPFLLLAALAVGSFAQAAEKRAWPEILKVAEGQAVYWNAWGGDARVNAYIAWVGDQVKERYRITLHPVKLAEDRKSLV